MADAIGFLGDKVHRLGSQSKADVFSSCERAGSACVRRLENYLPCLTPLACEPGLLKVYIAKSGLDV